MFYSKGDGTIPDFLFLNLLSGFRANLSPQMICTSELKHSKDTIQTGYLLLKKPGLLTPSMSFFTATKRVSVAEVGSTCRS